MKVYDLIIIGAGPAGLAAAIYSARYNLDFLVIGKLPGGLAGEAYKVCNYPSYESISGTELMMKMLKQVKSLDVKIEVDEVQDIKKQKNYFQIITNSKKYSAKNIILAMGSERRKLQVKNEKKFMGKGVSYCATCDASFYKDKIVGIVGGSDAALTAALLLSNYAKKVYIIYRKEKFFRAEPAWIEKVKKNKKIKYKFNSVVTGLIGKEKLETVEINNKEKLKLEGLFVEIGSVPNIELAKKLGLKTRNDKICVNRKQETSKKGIYAAGDITDNPFDQIVTACAEGATASNSVYKNVGE